MSNTNKQQQTNKQSQQGQSSIEQTFCNAATRAQATLSGPDFSRQQQYNITDWQRCSPTFAAFNAFDLYQQNLFYQRFLFPTAAATGLAVATAIKAAELASSSSTKKGEGEITGQGANDSKQRRRRKRKRLRRRRKHSIDAKNQVQSTIPDDNRDVSCRQVTLPQITPADGGSTGPTGISLDNNDKLEKSIVATTAATGASNEIL